MTYIVLLPNRPPKTLLGILRQSPPLTPKGRLRLGVSASFLDLTVSEAIRAAINEVLVARGTTGMVGRGEASDVGARAVGILSRLGLDLVVLDVVGSGERSVGKGGNAVNLLGLVNVHLLTRHHVDLPEPKAVLEIDDDLRKLVNGKSTEANKGCDILRCHGNGVGETDEILEVGRLALGIDVILVLGGNLGVVVRVGSLLDLGGVGGNDVRELVGIKMDWVEGREDDVAVVLDTLGNGFLKGNGGSLDVLLGLRSNSGVVHGLHLRWWSVIKAM